MPLASYILNHLICNEFYTHWAIQILNQKTWQILLLNNLYLHICIKGFISSFFKKLIKFKVNLLKAYLNSPKYNLFSEEMKFSLFIFILNSSCASYVIKIWAPKNTRIFFEFITINQSSLINLTRWVFK